jgi:hypothetical protein
LQKTLLQQLNKNITFRIAGRQDLKGKKQKGTPASCWQTSRRRHRSLNASRVYCQQDAGVPFRKQNE